jgi:hypothetical protein
MKPKSDNLFHFTKSLNVIKLILENGFHPRYCLEDISWIEKAPESHAAFAMTCFCDIPLTRIGEHTQFYGRYGIGMTKEWGQRNGLEPVVYVVPGRRVADVALYLIDFDYEDKLDQDGKSEHVKHTVNLLRFIKPIRGAMIVDSQMVEKDFYQENEWRYAPNTNRVIARDRFQDMKDVANRLAAESHALSFVPGDIKYIFVDRDDEIPELVDFINSSLGKFSHDELKILVSRIVSLGTIESDL